MNKKARIVALGSYLPERVLSNKDLEKIVETSDEWIVSRTGMKERRIARDDEFPSDMGAAAALSALKSSHLKPTDIDLIITATMSPDYISPSTAGIIQAKIGAPQAAAFDISAACSGFLYALTTAKAFIESGIYRNVLVIASEKMSSIIDYTDRNTCVLFGDGAAAAVVAGSGAGLEIESICLGADGSEAKVAHIPAGGARHPASEQTVKDRMHFFKMEGKELFKHAVRRMEGATRECLAKSGIQAEHISWLIPHQANTRIIEAIAKRFEEEGTKIYNAVHRYGNTSAASVAIALDDLLKEEEFQVGERFLLVAFGAGLTWGAGILAKVNN